ncbi:RNA polymerase sigma factor SigJ [Paracoccus aminophilus]|uniref:RNA polymerase sigma-70 factor n=1 Tax=Paracoccus aminophilus JCM 7686 TaxID=1367847 RepID=S5YXI0_PARAH|nr:RNA polymerase sigma factor SigJ [Paracoccus aminophilus]AGT09921.1 RNA polymerase sigma-70 factor [Paracoccus aminophilus JCM 7686]
MPPDPQAAIFEGERRRLMALAYRMTGSVAESEDLVQQAWLRFAQAEGVEDSARWMSTVVTRLALDHLKSARVRREAYVGAWLPEPILSDAAPDAEAGWIVTEEVGIALVLMLERLTPEMRAAFLLRDAFDYGFDEIGAVLWRSEAACRQLVSRARKRLIGVEPVAARPIAEAAPIVTAFWRASREGDMQALLDLFAEEIEVHTDGGGKVTAAINVLQGRRRAAQLFAGIARKWPMPERPCPPLCRINGSPGFVSTERGGIRQTTALEIREGRITAIWIMRNPDKLRHLPEAPAG